MPKKPIQYPPPRHVFLIVIDTLRADHLGCYGYQRPTSPNIDRLARDGVLCTRSYATASNTLESVVGLLTSSVDVTGFYYNKGVPAERSYLPEAFRKAGYNTFAVIANPWLSYLKDSFNRGIDNYNYVFGDSWEVDGIINSTDRVTHEVLATFSSKVSWRERNFFYIHYLDPHDPYRPPAAYSFCTGTPPSDPPFVHHVSGEEDVRSRFAEDPAFHDMPQPAAVSIDQLMFFINQYDGEIRQVDQAIGRLIKELDNLDVLKHSLLVLTSDHGEEFLEHGCFKHGFQLYRETIHVPLIFYYPRQLEPKRITDLVSGIDVAPTMLGICRITPPPGMLGRDILNPSQGEEPILFCTHFINQQKVGMKLPPYKVKKNKRANTMKIFNVVADPEERHNLLEKSDHRKFYHLLKQFEAAQQKHALIPQDIPAEPPAMDNRTRNQLKALGYLK